MKITNVEQLDNGLQKRPYADHIYKWRFDVDENNEERIINYCQTLFKKADRPYDEYIKYYRDESKSFDEHMKCICGGWYSLRQINDKTYEWEVHYEYID